MKRFLFVIFYLIICYFPHFQQKVLFAQESILSSYERNFIRASLAQKSRVLIDAASDEKADSFIGSLYNTAFDFILANGRALSNDSDMIALTVTASRGAGRAGSSAFGEDSGVVNKLWALFQMFSDPYSRVEILGAMTAAGSGNVELIRNLNLFLSGEVESFKRTGYSPNAGQNFPVLRACIDTLGAFGDSSSFPVLFTAMNAGFPQSVVQDCLKAMDLIHGDYQHYLLDVIRNNSFPEKAAAFRIGAYNEKFSTGDRGEIAQAALEVSIDNSGPAELSLRYDAITVLTSLRWSSAASLAIRNFYKVQSDFTGGIVPRERLLEAIVCLGAMSSSEAAKVLALQLGFINSQTEGNGGYDEEIVLAIIYSLGELADKSSFDNLLYVIFLDYPDNIKSAARDALNRLKW